MLGFLIYVLPMLLVIANVAFCIKYENHSRVVGIRTYIGIGIVSFLAFVPIINWIIIVVTIWNIVDDSRYYDIDLRIHK